MWGQQGGFNGGMQGGYGGGMQGGYGGGMQGGYGGLGGGYGGMGGGYGGNMGAIGINPGQPYKIVPASNQAFCLDSSGSTFSKHQLILYNYHGGNNQKFRFQPDNMGNYIIINCENGGALEP